MRNVGTSEWVLFIGWAVANKWRGLTSAHLLLAVRMLPGAFNYKTGKQNRPLSQSVLAERVGIRDGKAAGDRLRDLRNAGLLGETDRVGVRAGARKVPLHQCRVPEWFGNGEAEPSPGTAPVNVPAKAPARAVAVAVAVQDDPLI